MTNLKTPFYKLLSSPIKKALFIGLLSFLGLIDASYLAVKHYSGTIPTCAIVKGCEAVTTSQYAAIGGVSVALLGAIYYLIVLITSILIIDTKSDWLKKFLAGFSVIGLLASIWFISLQLFVLKALCLYCLVSAFSSTAIFITAFFLKKNAELAKSLSV